MTPRRVLAGLMIGMALAGPAWAQEGQAKPPRPMTMIVEFMIRDYDTWRPVFDGANAEREKLGITEPRVFRDADKPDHLLVMFRVASRQQGVAWLRSRDLHKAWREGGVIGTPTHRFAN